MSRMATNEYISFMLAFGLGKADKCHISRIGGTTVVVTLPPWSGVAYLRNGAFNFARYGQNAECGQGEWKP